MSDTFNKMGDIALYSIIFPNYRHFNHIKFFFLKISKELNVNIYVNEDLYLKKYSFVDNGNYSHEKQKKSN